MTPKIKPGYQITFPSDTEMVMTRVFNAPRALVFKAHVDPELIPQWWGSRAYTTRVEKWNPQPGGEWRFVSRGEDGSEIAFFGEFREIVAPERFTWTFGFEGQGLKGEPGVETYVFEEHGGKTTLTAISYYGSKDERDGLIDSGMEEGANESAERLDDLLARLQS